LAINLPEFPLVIPLLVLVVAALEVGLVEVVLLVADVFFVGFILS